MEANHTVIIKRQISVGRSRLLALQREADKETVELRLATLEFVDGVFAAQLLDPKPAAHLTFGCSNTLGSVSSLVMRGSGRGGASSMA